VERLLSRLDGLTFLSCREPWPGLDAEALIIEVERPTPEEQAVAWTTALGPEASETAAQLASQFSLGLPEIDGIAARQAALGRADLPGLWNACLERTRPRLDLLAERIEPRADWDDLVLPDDSRKLLNEISAQVDSRSTVYDTWGFRRKMSRGLGISALFAGESGVGKTMAAEVIANQLHLNLYRIDLSAVVSKYIGETEKNLRRLFDAADGGGAILFFDEADALFGKRSEVKDSHDRYANIEVNYLLQRMEAYTGLAILATNMRSALDLAFTRRLRFIVNFPVPGPTERKRIWLKVFPPDTPLELDDPALKVDFDRLAKVNLTGGSIHNAALNAAFRAARAKSKVTMPLLVEAIQTELKKMDRPVPPI
jgi:SpoVK/Ycf46/Vps4 family AAA+-type ATPase